MIIIHSASADLSADMPEDRFIKLKILGRPPGSPPPKRMVNIHFGGRCVIEFSRTFLIVHVVKTRAGGPTARLIAGCRAAMPELQVNVQRYKCTDSNCEDLNYT